MSSPRVTNGPTLLESDLPLLLDDAGGAAFQGTLLDFLIDYSCIPAGAA